MDYQNSTIQRSELSNFHIEFLSRDEAEPTSSFRSHAFEKAACTSSCRDPFVVAATQHTVSTVCSTLDGDGDDDNASNCWTEEDDISLVSLNEQDVFGGGHENDSLMDSFLLDTATISHQGADHKTEREHEQNFTTAEVYDDAIFKAIRVASFDRDHDDSVSVLRTFHDSQGSLDLNGVYEEYDAQLEDSSSQCQYMGYHELSSESRFDDSIQSLNEAFEKLNDCMLRTAQSRQIVREMATKSLPLAGGGECIVENDPSAPPSLSYQRASFIPSTGPLLLCRSDSSGSVCSLGSRSSRGSRSGSKRGRRSFNKSRRAFKKGTFSKTGVAPLKKHSFLQAL